MFSNIIVRIGPSPFWATVDLEILGYPKFGLCNFCRLETVDFTTILYFFPAARAMPASQTVNTPC